MLEKNQAAPDFASPNQDNSPVSLADFKDKKNVILYFYPKDDTPGCTIEANQFTELASEFAALDTIVIGVSKDSCESHQAFIDKFGLNLIYWPTLLANSVKNTEYGRRKKKPGSKKWASCVRLF